LYRDATFYIVVRTACNSCKSNIFAVTPMQVLLIPLPVRGPAAPGQVVETVLLSELVQNFASPNPVAWRCSDSATGTRCLAPQAAQTSCIFAPPLYLFLQLLRFAQDRAPGVGMTTIKDNCSVAYNAELDLRPILSPHAPAATSTLYDLSGVVLHRGNFHGGHYRTFSCSNGKWFLYNDSKVEAAEIVSVLRETSQVYVLLYKLRVNEADV